MNKQANSARPRPGQDTKRNGTAIALLAGLWPSLLGPEHGDGWRAQNRRAWRRRASHVALIAAIAGISAVAATPSFHRSGHAEASQQGPGPFAPHGRRGAASTPGGEAHDGAAQDGAGVRAWAAALRGRPDTPGAVDPTAPPSNERPEAGGRQGQAGAHGEQAPVSAPFWEQAAYSPTPGQYFGGVGGAGGGGGSASTGPSGPSGGGGSADPGPQTGSPGGRWTPYAVDPDGGSPAPDGPWPPTDKPPGRHPPSNGPTSSSPVSPVPEPQTWLLMIGGLGALGGVLRLRRGRVALVAARAS